MQIFKANKFLESNIELVDPDDLEKLYSALDAEENFILQWDEKDLQKSEVIIASNFSSKVKSGEIKLTAEKNI